MKKNIVTVILLLLSTSCGNVKEQQLDSNSNNELQFGNYECTQDCSGHKAGYNWAEKKGIDSLERCGGNNQSFIEGCYQYVQDNF